MALSCAGSAAGKVNLKCRVLTTLGAPSAITSSSALPDIHRLA
jgi:hypothetical protein